MIDVSVSAVTVRATVLIMTVNAASMITELISTVHDHCGSGVIVVAGGDSRERHALLFTR